MTDPRDPARGGVDPGHGDERYDPPTGSRYAPQTYLPHPPEEDPDPSSHGWDPQRGAGHERYVGHERHASVDGHPEPAEHLDAEPYAEPYGEPYAEAYVEQEHAEHEDVDHEYADHEYAEYAESDTHDGVVGPDHEASHDDEILFDHPDTDGEGLEVDTRTSSLLPRAERAAQRRAARRRRLRGAVVLVLALAVVAGAGVVAFGKLKPLLSFSSDSGDYPGPGTGSVSVTVADGDTATAIGATLEKAGVVKTAKAFAQAAAADPKGTSIQPGGYTLKSQMTAVAALAVLVDPANRSVPRVTIREGLWKSETFAALAKASGLPVSDYVSAAKDAAALGLPAAAKGNVEGWLFPATYEFPKESTASDQLQAMVAKTVEQLSSLGVADADTEKVLTIASIVQAEGRRADDLPKIARVIDNRLAQPMRLQLDSTVSYGVQKRALTTTDAERAADNGYNTYVRDGLPVGPISNPGASAITAAQAPADGPWLYFVAVNPETGETKFATTAAEHDANVAQFQQWCSDHPGTC